MSKKLIVIITAVILLILLIGTLIYFRLNPYYDEISVSEVCLGDVQIEGTCRELKSYKNIDNKYICLINEGNWEEIQDCSFTGCYRFMTCSVSK